MEINGFNMLMLIFNKRKKKIETISYIIIGMALIWVISYIIRNHANFLKLLPAIIVMIAIALFIIVSTIMELKKIKYSEKLLIKNKDLLSSEINNGIQDKDNNTFYTENFYIDFAINNAIKYEEIVLLYKSKITRFLSYKGGARRYIVAITKSGEKLEVLNYQMPKINKEVFDFLTSKCKNALIDRTEENIKIIKEKYNIEV